MKSVAECLDGKGGATLSAADILDLLVPWEDMAPRRGTLRRVTMPFASLASALYWYFRVAYRLLVRYAVMP